MSDVIRRAIAIAALTLAVLVLSLAWARPAAAATASRDAGYQPPVAAPVERGFDAPETPYGAGHRGLEYATASGVPVAAAAAGTVEFSGLVAGRRWVTVRHADGIRTTYGPLATSVVAPGDRVGAGDPVGTAAGRLLLTARLADAYVDPAALLGSGDADGSVRLVPDPADTVSGFLRRQGGGSALDRLGAVVDPGALAAAIEWERDTVREEVATIAEVTPIPVVRDTVASMLEWHRRQQHCTEAGVAVPAPYGRRFAVLVGGLGSSSTNAAIDDVPTGELGYEDGDVVRFSYGGGRVPAGTPSDELAGLRTSDYAPADTTRSLDASARLLADFLASVVDAAPPSVVVDVYAHSQGGLVTRLALDDLARDRPDVVTRLGLVAAMASPFEGADLATLADRLGGEPIRGQIVQHAGDAAGLGIGLDDEAVRDLAPGSDVVRRLDHDPPAGPTYLSVAGRGDPVVPAPRAHERGATNVTVSVSGLTSHVEVPGAAATSRELRLALAGEPPSCESMGDALLDGVIGSAIQHGEHLLSVTG